MHDLVAERVVGTAFLEQCITVERQRLDRLERARLEALAAAHDDRGPAEFVAALEVMHAQGLALHLHLERHAAVQQQEELVLGVALGEDDLVLGEFHGAREPGQGCAMLGREPLHERVVLHRV